jgi:periplasmic protein TonB
MDPKKNPKVDLTKNSSLYFAIGLCLVLFVSWRLIEHKTYDKSDFNYETLQIEDDDDELVPITEQLKTPPPPAPTIIEVVEDEKEVEETIIESTETTQEQIIEDVEVIEEEVDVEVPFAIIEDVPLFPGCENVKKSERRKCFQEKIQRHIAKNFRYPEIAQEMGIQGRVYVQFIISKDGSITGIRTRGPDKNLEKEAQRIIERLPVMIPGKQRGRPVRVPFSIPINFRLE